MTDDLRALVLAAVADDIEEFATIIEIVRDESSVPYEVDQISACVQGLLRDGYLHAWEPHPDEYRLVPVYEPEANDDALRRYWYKPSDAGEVLRETLRRTSRGL